MQYVDLYVEVCPAGAKHQRFHQEAIGGDHLSHGERPLGTGRGYGAGGGWRGSMESLLLRSSNISEGGGGAGPGNISIFCHAYDS